MTAEDRAAHVEREAVAGVDTLASWLCEWVERHQGTTLRDTGHSLVLECLCGADLGIRYGPSDGGNDRAESLAYFAHQAADLRAAFPVLAALPQTGDAADDRLICCPECRSVFEAEDHTIHDGDEMAALARVFALADEWEAAGTVSVYESAGELGQILRAALTAGADQ